jgi:hypothetical protein
MTEKDAKSQTLRVRRNQEGRALLSDSYKHRGFGQDGTAEENLSLRTGRENRSRSDSDRSPRGTTVGGILRQLIEEADDQLAYHDSQIKKLTQRREQLQQLYEELQQKAGEDNGEPQEDEELESAKGL